MNYHLLDQIWWFYLYSYNWTWFSFFFPALCFKFLCFQRILSISNLDAMKCVYQHFCELLFFCLSCSWKTSFSSSSSLQSISFTCLSCHFNLVTYKIKEIKLCIWKYDKAYAYLSIPANSLSDNMLGAWIQEWIKVFHFKEFTV